MIVWDLGGVVARFDHEARVNALADATGLLPDHIDEVVWRSGLDAAADKGYLDQDTAWSQVLAALEDRIDRSELRRCWSLAFIANQEVIDVIGRLGEPCALFTDNGPILSACLEHELRHLGRPFEHVLFSWRLKATKSDLVSYQRAGAALDAEPSRLTLVDDRASNVETARAAGWYAIHFNTVDDLEQLLSPYSASDRH